MTTRFKFFFLLISMMLCVSLNSWAYDDWTSTNTGSGSSSSSNEWKNIEVPAGKYVLVDYEVNGGVSDYLWLSFNDTGTSFSGKVNGTYIFLNHQTDAISLKIRSSYSIRNGGNGYAKVTNIRISDNILSSFNGTIKNKEIGVRYSVPIICANNFDIKDKISYTSSNDKVVKVDGNGSVSGVALGTATVTATATDGSGTKASCKVDVKKIESISLQNTYIGVNDCYTYIGITTNYASYSGSNLFTWKSSDESIAEVSGDGWIKPIKEGIATITATATDGSNLSGTCKVTVTPGYAYRNLGGEANIDYAYTDCSQWDYIYVNKYGSSYYKIGEYGGSSDYYGGYGTQNNDELTIGINSDSFTSISWNIYYSNLKKYDNVVDVLIDGNSILNECGIYEPNSFNDGTITYELSKSQYILSSGKHEIIFRYNGSSGDSEKDFFLISSLYIEKCIANTFEDLLANNKLDVIKVGREGILGAEALKIHGNLSDFKALKVIGPLDEYDWKTIDEMNLTCLDLTEASGVYPSSGRFYNLKAVKLSNNIADITRNYFPYATYVYIPDGVTNFSSGIGANNTILVLDGGKGVRSIGDSAFDGKYVCGNLQFNNLESVGNYAFRNSIALEGIYMPKVKNIGSNAFEGCGLLKDIDMSDVSQLGNSAFKNCGSLTNVSAPKLKNIAPFAFYNSKIIDAKFAVADTIGEYAFALTSANTISCPNVKYIDTGAFSAAYKYSEKRSSGYFSSYREKIDYTSKRIVSVNVPSVEVINDSAFYHQSAIENMVTPKLKKVGEYAFATGITSFWNGETDYTYGDYESSLKNIDLSSVTEIDNYAFYHCKNLQSVSIPNAIKISSNAFYNCDGIKSLDAPRVTFIGDYAFYSCNALETISILKAETICNGAFNGCNKLQAVNLPKINYIGNNAFNGCSSVKTIDLSDKLTELGENCFYGCTGVETLTLPASITKIPTQCFAGSNNIKTINCNAPAPPAVGETPFNMQTLYTAKLRVPEPSIVLYQADNYWKHFYYYETNPDVLTDLIISNPTDMGDVRMEKVNLTLKTGASLAMTGNDAQSFRSVLFLANSNESGMFISKSERITSDATKIELDMPALKWRFLALPYDVNISDIERSVEDAQMAIYKYDGSKRASSGTGYAWTRVNSGTLTAGTGYIIQTSKATALTFPAPYAHKDKPFQPYDVTTKLAANTSSTAANQGWNFVGNPYMAYYDISKLELNAPITIWNGTTYDAYSPKDDEYALRPMQPFFVQCPANVKSLKFNAAGRQATSTITKATEARARYNAKDNAERKVVDIAISTEGETQADRTRFVINNKATDDYELSCDAAKMMSMDENVAQIYTVSRGIQYAINEGPQLAGKVMIGIVTPKVGKYTLNALRSDMDVMLHDEETGETVNLTEGAYTFDAGEGVNESRFYVVLGNETTKVSGVAADGINGTTEVYDLDGRRKDEATKGVNIIRQNGKVSKQMNR